MFDTITSTYSMFSQFQFGVGRGNAAWQHPHLPLGAPLVLCTLVQKPSTSKYDKRGLLHNLTKCPVAKSAINQHYVPEMCCNFINIYIHIKWIHYPQPQFTKMHTEITTLILLLFHNKQIGKKQNFISM